MLELSQIESWYPEPLRPFKKNLLREYLQYKILEIIFTSPYANSLAFMGGTAIRFVHAGKRFSEDLDFDNRSLDQESFENLAGLLHNRLTLEGYETEVKNTIRTTYRSSIRIPKILFYSGISRHRDERLTIQVDTEPQGFDYTPEKVILNKFDVFVRIHVVPVDILLSQKITCLFTRKRPMGRDFYDIIFLLGKSRPNLDYLKDKLGIADREAIRKQILLKCKELDFSHLARDVAPFLMQKQEAEKILHFSEYLKAAEL
ncbi:MAG: nucleotidyl transferase AbiEii/AbiGii toxin family protein [Deltaproteobacteria bacterium]|nr:nucleotidyl transferase AbiEii/AbiGii toxin family protein [Deltaproteobacteria bacterium]